MFLFDWIKEGLGLFLVAFLLSAMLGYSILSPSGVFQHLLFLGALAITFFINAGLTPTIYLPIYVVILRPGLTIAVRVPLAIISILIYIFVRTPLHYMGASSSWIWNGLKNSESNLTKEVTKEEKDDYGNIVDESTVQRPKLRYIGVFLTFALLMFYTIGFDVSTLSSLITDATLLVVPMIFLPVILTLIVSGISLKLSGRSVTQEPENNQRQLDPYDTASSAYDAGKEAHGLYKDLKNPQKRKQMKQGAKSAANTGRKAANKARKYGGKAGRMADQKVGNKGLQSIINQLSKIPGVKRLAPRLASLGGSTAGLSTVLFLLVILLILIIVWIIIAGIFVLLFGGILRFVALPFLGQTFGPAVGLGADYASFGIGELGVSGPSMDLSAERNALQLAGARISCALEGPACLQQWQENNSERPGSESVGTEFGLDIEEFDVNQGNTIDIAGRGKEGTIPITLQVYNTIQGLKGITARDARYRVNIYDGNTMICSSADSETSDWSYLGSSFVGGSDDDRGTIPPGGFSNPSGQLEELTFGNCGLLQPGLGEQDVTDAKAEIRYNYSSQSTLSFRAMSEQYRTEESIRQEVKQSQTANTPVQTYVNVENPVTYIEDSGERDSRIFTTRIGFQTERLSTDYRIDVDDFELDASSAVIDVDRAEVDRDGYNCEDLTYDEDEDVYELSDSKKEEIKNTQSSSWYSKGFAPEASCSMVLKEDEIGTISPTGETLNMRVDGNYTVKTMSSSTSFETKNTRCSSYGFECPLIVPNSQEESKELVSGESYPILRSDCDSSWNIQASRNGCTVVENQENWGSPEIINSENSFSETIENRETAYMLSEVENIAEGPDRRVIKEYDHLTNNSESAAIGLREDLEELEDNDESWVVEAEGDGDSKTVDIRSYDRVYCSSESSDDIIRDLNSQNAILASIKVAEDSGSQNRKGTYGGYNNVGSNCIKTD